MINFPKIFSSKNFLLATITLLLQFGTQQNAFCMFQSSSSSSNSSSTPSWEYVPSNTREGLGSLINNNSNNSPSPFAPNNTDQTPNKYANNCTRPRIHPHDFTTPLPGVSNFTPTSGSSSSPSVPHHTDYSFPQGNFSAFNFGTHDSATPSSQNTTTGFSVPVPNSFGGPSSNASSPFQPFSFPSSSSSNNQFSPSAFVPSSINSASSSSIAAPFSFAPSTSTATPSFNFSSPAYSTPSSSSGDNFTSNFYTTPSGTQIPRVSSTAFVPTNYPSTSTPFGSSSSFNNNSSAAFPFPSSSSSNFQPTTTSTYNSGGMYQNFSGQNESNSSFPRPISQNFTSGPFSYESKSQLYPSSSSNSEPESDVDVQPSSNFQFSSQQNTSAPYVWWPLPTGDFASAPSPTTSHLTSWERQAFVRKLKRELRAEIEKNTADVQQNQLLYLALLIIDGPENYVTPSQSANVSKFFDFDNFVQCNFKAEPSDTAFQEIGGINVKISPDTLQKLAALPKGLNASLPGILEIISSDEGNAPEVDDPAELKAFNKMHGNFLFILNKKQEVEVLGSTLDTIFAGFNKSDFTQKSFALANMKRSLAQNKPLTHNNLLEISATILDDDQDNERTAPAQKFLGIGDEDLRDVMDECESPDEQKAKLCDLIKKALLKKAASAKTKEEKEDYNQQLADFKMVEKAFVPDAFKEFQPLPIDDVGGPGGPNGPNSPSSLPPKLNFIQRNPGSSLTVALLLGAVIAGGATAAALKWKTLWPWLKSFKMPGSKKAHVRAAKVIAK